MNSEPQPPPRRMGRGMMLGGALLAAALGGAFVLRLLSPSQKPSGDRQAEPIVEIVRPQAALPDLADLVDRLCPSVAMVVARGSAAPPDSGGPSGVPAFVYSPDGWLVTSASALPPGQLDAVFGDGRRESLSDVRTDPVSALAVAKVGGTAVGPLPFSDQAFPRVGQFGIGLAAPAGAGCSAIWAMIGSDFVADGAGPTGYVRLQPAPVAWAAGMPFLNGDGQILGVGADNPPGAVIPAPIASVIIAELVRGSLSPSTKFGFRAVDFAARLSGRLGDVRSGAGIALVQDKARAGLQAGDVVTAVDGVPISSASELSRALDGAVGKATLTVERRSRHLKLTVRAQPG